MINAIIDHLNALKLTCKDKVQSVLDLLPKSKNRARRSAPLGFLGNWVGNSLGLTTESEKEILEKKMGKIYSKISGVQSDLTHVLDDFSSFSETTTKEFEHVERILELHTSQVRELYEHSIGLQNREQKLSESVHLIFPLRNQVVSDISKVMMITNYVDSVRHGLEALLGGSLSRNLVTEPVLERALSQAKVSLFPTGYLKFF